MMKHTKMPIKYVEWGLANNFGTHIEMNKELLNYPKLYDSILRHEIGHTDNHFTWYDLKHDLKGTEYPLAMLKFMVKHPKSLTQLLPLYWSKNKGIVYDLNLSLIYVFFGIVITGSFWLASGL